MSILDAILENSGAKVVREEHDVNAINWVAGLSDPGEMIACGYLPELRRLANEQDATYAARILPLVMALPLDIRQRIMGSAIDRASLDVTNGKVSVMVAVGPNGERLPWHQLGTMVESAVNSADAARLANIDWKVVKLPLAYAWKAELLESDSAFAIVREDTGKQLGTVGTQYKPIQNGDGFSFLDSVLEQYGARYETAGAIYGGAKVWMQARLPEQSFEVRNGDKVETFVMFTLSHDGTAANHCFPTTNRTVCANTFRIAYRDRGAKGLSIRHTGDVKAKVREAQRVLGLAVKGFDNFKAAAEQMVRTPLAVEPYANDVLDAVLEITAAQAKLGTDALAAVLMATEADAELAAKKAERLIEKRENLLTDILERYDSERCNPYGTAWAAFNSVTEAADWGKLGGRQVGKDKASRRFESVVAGDADTVKQVAYNTVLAAMAS